MSCFYLQLEIEKKQLSAWSITFDLISQACLFEL